MTLWERFRRALKHGAFWREIEAINETTARIEATTRLIEANNERLLRQLGVTNQTVEGRGQ